MKRYVLLTVLTSLAYCVLPTQASAQSYRMIVLDTSTSMEEIHVDGKTRLEIAKETAIGQMSPSAANVYALYALAGWTWSGMIVDFGDVDNHS